MSQIRTGTLSASKASRATRSRHDAAKGDTESTPNDTAAVDDDYALVAALKSGQREAYRSAVARYSARMIATARSIVGSAQAEDIVQDAWMTVFRQIGTFEHRSSLNTWLQRIVTNKSISYLRAHRREVSPPNNADGEIDSEWFDAAGSWAAPLQDWDSATPDDLLSAEALQDCIDKHLDLMPDSQRQVMVMRDMQQESFEEICNVLTLSTSNARVLLHRARLRMMKMVDHFQETGTC